MRLTQRRKDAKEGYTAKDLCALATLRETFYKTGKIS